MASQFPADPETDISSGFPFSLKFTDVLDATMAYVDTGTPPGGSDTVTALFLHGNPTSSYVYRNIIPHISGTARCVAPDLVGMGFSSKPNITYRFFEHANYLDAFLQEIVPHGKVIFLVQDWGSALGFDWAFRHQDRIAGLALMEFVRPRESWDDAMQGKAQEMFRAFRDEEKGRRLLIDQNAFINIMLPRGMIRPLKSEEMEYYSRPYEEPMAREPLFRWPNEIPIDGHPADVAERVAKYHDWLLETDLPKLYFWATPGRIISEKKRYGIWSI